jgi:hypothetical protein
MKTLIKDLKIDQVLRMEKVRGQRQYGYDECTVAFIYENYFEVQFISGACRAYYQKDLDSGLLETFIG